ncbi:hypothetical protein ACHAXR_002757, partial [Thalassiosira sp. AJA248-18]
MVSTENDLLLPSSTSSLECGVLSSSSQTSQRKSYARLHSYLSPGSTKYSCYVPVLLAIVGVAISIVSFVPILMQQKSLHSRLSTAGLPLLGRSNSSSKGSKKQQSNASKKNGILSESYNCESDKSYSKHTLKRAYDLPYAALFSDTRGQSKFEASDVTIVNDTVYSVCDSSWAISKFTRELVPFSEMNVQIGDPDIREGQEGEESGYEAIFEHGGRFYVVRESVYHEGLDHNDDDDEYEDEHEHEESKHGDYHAIIEELDLQEDDYTLVRECKCEFVFEGDSKGFEGAVGFPDDDGKLYILGLCEGNHCSEEKKNDVGNGRVVLMTKREEDGGDEVTGTSCLWETVRVVNIPKSAAFLDYSAIDMTPEGRVAIASQEHSSVWLGHATGISNGIIDPAAFEFEDDDSTFSVLQFPKDGGCHTIYCNIEGIHFMNDEMLMAVSDKMKGKGRQDFRCH